jgi:hypothetical protein
MRSPFSYHLRINPMLYLLHFDPRYRHAGHYLGYTANLVKRFGLHLKGRGSPLVAAAVRSGSKVTLVRIWAGDGNAEQEFKRCGSRARLCPLCNPNAARRMTAYKSKLLNIDTPRNAKKPLAAFEQQAR